MKLSDVFYLLSVMKAKVNFEVCRFLNLYPQTVHCILLLYICNNLKVLNIKILKAYLKYGKIPGIGPQRVLTQKVNLGVSRYADQETN